MIIWGTKRVEKALGRAADYCPMCRAIRCFRVRKISMVSHIYFFGLGRGETVGHFGSCETCGFELGVDPTGYAALAKPRSDTGARELVQETFPNIGEVYSERFELEKQLRSSSSSLDPELRQELIREVLQNAAPAVEERYSSGVKLDWRAGLSLAATLLVPVILLNQGHALASQATYDSVVRPLSLVVLLAGLVATSYFGATANGRWLHAHILPMLARAFKPLQPTEQELEQLLAKFRTADLKIGKKLKPQWVCQTLQESRVKPIA